MARAWQDEIATLLAERKCDHCLFPWCIHWQSHQQTLNPAEGRTHARTHHCPAQHTSTQAQEQRLLLPATLPNPSIIIVTSEASVKTTLLFAENSTNALIVTLLRSTVEMRPEGVGMRVNRTISRTACVRRSVRLDGSGRLGCIGNSTTRRQIRFLNLKATLNQWLCRCWSSNFAGALIRR